ncbi:solute carrier organic anion transporter family member 74D [Leptopilina boulardi]|uniref:solute carrier organic anion transporter family member 74D n=1 Tax=Leptopilina boulardi TaxID=63433 RepID=UPI0021F611EE|nr:solute carrier organic anion transporter family member 74D [Leptopilina boulardi]
MDEDAKCGLCGIYPKWLAGRATSKVFIIVYGLLGTVQSMAFVYVMVTLTTLEKRFKIPSQTTGIILSGNEISQILSLVLTYYGGSGHRPRWIAVGVALSGLSCFVLALPHFIYGPGKDALALTSEYLDQNLINSTSIDDLPTCSGEKNQPHCDEESLQDISILPRLLVFLSQFILGIGTTLYYGLGQTYLDDNTRKKNTPMLLGFTFALRTLGPVVGFVLGYACLSLYINPTLHPVITKEDPRWLGAWWLGWIILGTTMAMFAVFIAMFPRHLPKSNTSSKKPQIGEEPLKHDCSPKKMEKIKENSNKKIINTEIEFKPTVSDFMTSMKRLMLNPILTCNNLSGVFYILGASAYITFMSKYMEVLFGVSAAGSSMITGPITLIGMVLGFLVSGIVISKYKPGPRILLGWNVIIGLSYILGQIAFLFLSCPGTQIQGIDPNSMQINLNFPCNADCSCDNVKYSPVCYEPTMTTFFSACHAGCKKVLSNGEYGNCSCTQNQMNIQHSYYELNANISSLTEDGYLTTNIFDIVKAGACKNDCKKPYLILTIIMCLIQLLTCSGKIGNVLVNYRSVEDRDKAFAQGITLMLISLLALIPGPIIYGALIDSTCLVWDEACGMKGNCWVYDPDKFRNYINSTAICFTIIGVIFDIGVWYLGKNVDLYGANDDMRHDFVKSLTVEQTNNAEKHENKNST